MRHAGRCRTAQNNCWRTLRPVLRAPSLPVNGSTKRFGGIRRRTGPKRRRNRSNRSTRVGADRGAHHAGGRFGGSSGTPRRAVFMAELIQIGNATPPPVSRSPSDRLVKTDPRHAHERLIETCKTRHPPRRWWLPVLQRGRRARATSPLAAFVPTRTTSRIMWSS